MNTLAFFRSPMFSDGRYLYILSQVVEKKKRARSSMVAALSTPARYEGESKSSAAPGASSTIDMSALELDIDSSDDERDGSGGGGKNGDDDEDDDEDEEDEEEDDEEDEDEDDPDNPAAQDARDAQKLKVKPKEYIVDVWDPSVADNPVLLRRVPLWLVQTQAAQSGKEAKAAALVSDCLRHVRLAGGLYSQCLPLPLLAVVLALFLRWVGGFLMPPTFAGEFHDQRQAAACVVHDGEGLAWLQAQYPAS